VLPQPPNRLQAKRSNDRIRAVSSERNGETDFFLLKIGMALKLRQGQVWKHGNEFIRIVKLERLEVSYLTFKKLKPGTGQPRHTSKKDFCRLLKTCTLLDPKPARPATVPQTHALPSLGLNPPENPIAT
jgi:hypothetical protein